jgi:hypothetical protein
MSCLMPSIKPMRRSESDPTIVYKVDVTAVMNGYEAGSKVIGLGGPEPTIFATEAEAVDWIEDRLTRGFTAKDTIDWFHTEHRDVASAMAHIRADPMAPHREDLEFL